MNSNLFKYIKKISIYTLVFIVCFMMGNSEVSADWVVGFIEYQKNTGWYFRWEYEPDIVNPFNKYDYESEYKEKFGLDTYCEYPNVQLDSATSAKKRTYKIYWSKNSDKVVIARGIDGSTWNNDNITIRAGLDIEGLNKAVNNKVVVCPIIYSVRNGDHWEYFGYTDANVRQTNPETHFELVPTTPKKSSEAKICMGSRADFVAWDSFKGSYKSIGETEATTLVNDLKTEYDNIEKLTDVYADFDNDVWKNIESVNKIFGNDGSASEIWKKIGTLEQTKIDYMSGNYANLLALEDGGKKTCDTRCGLTVTKFGGCTELTKYLKAFNIFNGIITTTKGTTDADVEKEYAKIVEEAKKRYEDKIAFDEAEAARKKAEDLRIQANNVFKNARKPSITGKYDGGSDGMTCSGLFSDDLLLVIRTLFKIICIATPILLIILCAVDFSQAVISQDQDIMKKTISKVLKRAIAALAIFFIPLLVSVLLKMPGISDLIAPDCDVNTLITE